MKTALEATEKFMSQTSFSSILLTFFIFFFLPSLLPSLLIALNGFKSNLYTKKREKKNIAIIKNKIKTNTLSTT
ncbi:MAG: hypothetical protein AB8B46_00715 [Candidatus Midichloriaceae bacterium]